MNSRILHLLLAVKITPPQDEPLGETDEAAAIGEKLTLEVGLLAQRLANACFVKMNNHPAAEQGGFFTPG